MILIFPFKNLKNGGGEGGGIKLKIINEILAFINHYNELMFKTMHNDGM